jgi:uroporphyrinogen-III synthase
MCEEIRYEVPIDLKYFCVSEAIAFYLQKYVVFRKRKIYFGKLTFQDLIPTLKKHKTEKFLLPTSDILKPDIPTLLDSIKINYTRAILYRTVCSDLSDLEDVNADPDSLLNGMVLVYNQSTDKWDATLELTPGNTQNLDINGGSF